LVRWCKTGVQRKKKEAQRWGRHESSGERGERLGVGRSIFPGYAEKGPPSSEKTRCPTGGNLLRPDPHKGKNFHALIMPRGNVYRRGRDGDMNTTGVQKR